MVPARLSPRRCIANLLGGFGATTLLNLCNGNGSNKQPWNELRTELDRLGIPWAAPKRGGRAQGPSRARQMTTVSWRVLPGTEHIEVTRIDVLTYGTDEHREFLRDHCGDLARATT